MQIEKYYRWLGISILLVSGLIHLINTPGELQYSSPHIGLLFIDFFIAAVISAIGIHQQSLLLGWGLGSLISLGSVITYLISRTIGLPLSGIEKWGPVNAYFAIAFELLFVVIAIRVRQLQLRVKEVIP